MNLSLWWPSAANQIIHEYISLVAQRCQSNNTLIYLYGGPALPIKRNKNNKNKKKLNKIKNENKKIEKIKNILFRKKTHKIIMAHECQIR